MNAKQKWAVGLMIVGVIGLLIALSVELPASGGQVDDRFFAALAVTMALSPAVWAGIVGIFLWFSGSKQAHGTVVTPKKGAQPQAAPARPTYPVPSPPPLKSSSGDAPTGSSESDLDRDDGVAPPSGVVESARSTTPTSADATGGTPAGVWALLALLIIVALVVVLIPFGIADSKDEESAAAVSPNTGQAGNATTTSTTPTAKPTATLPSAIPADWCDDSKVGTEALSPGGVKLVCTKAGPYGAWPFGWARWWDSGEGTSTVADPTRGEREESYVAEIRSYSEDRPRNWVDELKDSEIASLGWGTCALLEQTERELGDIPEDILFLQWQKGLASLQVDDMDDIDDRWTASEMVRLSMEKATNTLCPWYGYYGHCMTQKTVNLSTGIDVACLMP